MENFIIDVDSYKFSHYKQYPPDTKYLKSYVEARSDGNGLSKEIVFFGLQMILQKTIANKVTKEMVEEAKEIADLHGFKDNFNYDGWMKIVNDLNGKIPLIINAIPEGTVVPYSNCLMTIENTHPDFPWLVSWFETQLLRLWYPCSVATLSRSIKKIIKKYLDETSDDPEAELPFKLHDFGSRGVSSRESAEIGGLAHLVNFKGTDTVVALLAGRKYYSEPMAGFSIPASEHSTITSWSMLNESDAYRNMLDKFGKPGTLFACVSDSYDLDYAIENIWGDELKMKLIESGATLVVRPDSGHPATVVLKSVQSLDKKFGSKINSKGYRVLDSCVRVIQGDGIDEQSVQEILETLKLNGYSATNITFGMGGALLQKVNRDTFSFAYKTCFGIFQSENQKPIKRVIFKNPKGDHSKSSKTGDLTLTKTENGEYKTVTWEELDFDSTSTALVCVFDDGEIVEKYSLAEVRENASI